MEALPHRLDEEDEYMGYRIPKGTMVFGNIWSVIDLFFGGRIESHSCDTDRALMHNPTIYESPMEFKPERFLDPTNIPTLDPFDIAFGFGRR